MLVSGIVTRKFEYKTLNWIIIIFRNEIYFAIDKIETGEFANSFEYLITGFRNRIKIFSFYFPTTIITNPES